MPALIICKFDDDPNIYQLLNIHFCQSGPLNQNGRSVSLSMETPFSHYKSMEKFFVAPKSVIRYGRNSNSFEMLCLSWLPASLTKIRSKVKATVWRHGFSHYKSTGAFCCHGNHSFDGERGGSVVECRTPEREVGGSRPTAAMLCPWARHFTPWKYRLITQEAMAPSRHDWKIVDWDVKPQHNQPTVLMESAPKPKSSLSSIPLMLHINFDQDWPTDLGDSIISLLKI